MNLSLNRMTLGSQTGNGWQDSSDGSCAASNRRILNDAHQSLGEWNGDVVSRGTAQNGSSDAVQFELAAGRMVLRHRATHGSGQRFKGPLDFCGVNPGSCCL